MIMLSIIKQFLVEQKKETKKCPKGQQWCTITKRCVPIGSGTGDGPRRRRPRTEKRELVKEPPVEQDDIKIKKIKELLNTIIDEACKIPSEKESTKKEKKIKESFSILNRLLNEGTYQTFFQSVMKKYGIKELSELTGERRKKFFDDIDSGWKSKKEKK